MRKLLCFLAISAAMSIWVSCRKSERHPAGKAAMTYYGYLIDGRHDDYVNAIAYSDSMTDEYKSQMVDLVAQYVAREKEQRGGLVGVRLVGDTIAENMASAFLEISYGDSTSEEIAVPMVLCDGVWKMQ